MLITNISSLYATSMSPTHVWTRTTHHNKLSNTCNTYCIKFNTKIRVCVHLSVGFEPHANMAIAHHILLYGCEVPGSDSVWLVYTLAFLVMV